MRTSTKAALGLLILPLFSSAAHAFGTGEGTASSVTVEDASGKFSLSGTHSNAPVCASTARWAVDISTAKGQAMWSTLLLAFSMNRAVAVGGTGQCDVWGDSETISWLRII